MRTPVVVFLGLVVSGCAAQPETPESVAAAPIGTAAEAPRIVCKKEKPTGSNRPVTVCREVLGALDQEQSRHDLRTLQRQSDALKRQADGIN